MLDGAARIALASGLLLTLTLDALAGRTLLGGPNPILGHLLALDPRTLGLRTQRGRALRG